MLTKIVYSFSKLVKDSKKLYEEALDQMQETNVEHMKYEENLVNIF